MITKRYFSSLLTSATWWVGVLISLALAMLATRFVEGRAATEFAHQAANAESRIQANLHSYVDVLRGISALFATTDNVSRLQFRDYIQRLNLDQRFPAIRNINYAPRIFAKDKAAFEAAVRKDESINPNGYPEFAINPPGERDEHHVLLYQEPMESNLGTLGFDMASIEPVRKTLDVSRDTGELSASGRVIHISGPYRHRGLAIRLPLYKHGMPLDTVEERRAAYYGSVGAGFDIDRLMLGALPENMRAIMRVKLYDTGQTFEARSEGTTDPLRLLFDSAAQVAENAPLFLAARFNDRLVSRAPIRLGTRVWEVEFSASRSAMLTDWDLAMPWVIFVIGIAASFLLHSTYYSLRSARERSIEMASEMTKDLRASEAHLAEAQRMARLGSWVLLPDFGEMHWSNETYRLLGLDHATRSSFENFLECIPGDDRDHCLNGFELALREDKEFNTEHRIAHQDGGIRWVHAIVRPDWNDGKKVLRGTLMDITERKEALEALRHSQDMLRELTAHQDRVKEEERKRIAREIHDELGQTLLALRIDIAMLEARTGNAHPRLNQRVRAVLGHIDTTVRTIRTIINNLRPAVLDLGITAAIEWQVTEFERRSGIDCELLIGTQELVLDDTHATALFRVLQESLTNVLRHAEATRVVIHLFEENEQVVMRITDNGVGIYPSSRRKANSFGLVGLEERINALNGKFILNSAPGAGTTLTVYLPAVRNRQVQAA